MTHIDAKKILKEIGTNGVEFSRAIGRSKNYVTDLKRTGVSLSMVAVFNMMKALHELGESKEDILKLLPAYEESMLIRALKREDLSESRGKSNED